MEGRSGKEPSDQLVQRNAGGKELRLAATYGRAGARATNRADTAADNDLEVLALGSDIRVRAASPA